MVEDRPSVGPEVRSLAGCPACKRGRLAWNPGKRAYCCFGGKPGCLYGMAPDSLLDGMSREARDIDRMMREKPGEADG